MIHHQAAIQFFSADMCVFVYISMTRFIVTLIQLYHLLAFSSWYQKLIPMDSTMIWRDQTIIYNLTWNIQINITSSISSMNRAPLRLWNSQLTIRKFPIQSMFLGNTKNIASCTLPSLLVLVILKQWNMYIWIPAHLPPLKHETHLLQILQ